MNERILRATIDHLDLAARLLDAYRQHFACSPDLEACRAFLRPRLERHETVFLLAERAGTGLGFTQLIPLHSTIALGRAWLLNDLFVERAHRRQGIARHLLRAARDFAQGDGAEWLELAVARDNPAARALYAEFGFRPETRFDRLKLQLREPRRTGRP